ncbi:MAG TPA: carboxypeptidase-like regulatory domain-containing protein [Vicinamibacterales bacterium]|nr:carboxypeptidase-like regulatory domain-containing protein [Vicinamibacterales bacterium]
MLLFTIVLMAAAGQVYSPPAVPQTRDVRQLPEAAGTAVVRGRVVTSDGRPVKRVIVSLTQAMGGDSGISDASRPATRPVSRTTLSDAQGQFSFDGLPAGFYRITARPGMYQARFLVGGYGQKRPNDPGPPFELSDGQVFTGATIVMPASGVITGRVTDDEGEPVTRVPVSTYFFAPGSTVPARGFGASTDDRGQFRIFGLQPGDYEIFADVRDGNVQIDSETDPTGFVPTYFPGVPTEADAQHVQVRAGAETSGVDFRLIRGRLFTISGMVLNSQGQPVFPISVSVMQNTGQPEQRVVSGFSTDSQGHFTMRGVAPGDYTLAIRPRIAPQGAMVINGRRMPDLAEFATLDLRVDSDITDLVITTRPTLSIAGRVVFVDGVPPMAPGAPDPLRNIRISAAAALGTIPFSPFPPVQLAPDFSFTLNGLSSAVVLRVNGLPPNFVVKQVLVGAEDITDRGHEFVDRDSGQLQILVTSRVAGLEGTVVDAAGKPAVDSLVLLLLEPANGRHAALYRSGAVDPYGRFKMSSLRAGEFLVVAVPRDRMPRNGDTAAYDAIARDAQPITLGDGEFRVMDLKVSGGKQGAP